MKSLQFNVPILKGQSLTVQEDVLEKFYPYFHRHQEAQLMWIVKGSGVLVVEDALHPFGDNDIFFLGANQPHVFKSGVTDGFMDEVQSISVFFDPNGKLGSLFRLAEFDSIKRFINQNTNGFKVPEEHYEDVANRVLQLKSSDSMDKMMHFFYLLRTLSVVSKSAMPLCGDAVGAMKDCQRDGNRISGVCQYIESNYNKNLDLEDVAAFANFTPQAFCRYFKKHCGLTFVSYLNRIRVREACRRLSDDYLESISMIAYACGFNSITNFNRVFKQIVGCSPKEYISNYNNVLFEPADTCVTVAR